MADNQSQAVATKSEEKPMEFIPYGAQDKIKLTVEIVRNLVAVPSRSGKLPTTKDCYKFMMLANAKKLNPFDGDAFLLGYDNRDGTTSFSLITAHQAYLKRAEVHPEFDGMKSGVIVQNEDGTVHELEGDFHLENQTVLGGWASVVFKTRKTPCTRRVRLKRFQKSYGIWQDDPAGMICKCFDEETEILTTRGFEKFANAEGSVLQIGYRGLEITDAVPFVQDYSGPMVCLLSDDLNFSVTPNHDMYTSLGKIEAGEMYSRATSRGTFSIPRKLPFSNVDAQIPDSNIKLAAAYLADGSDKPDCSFWISVSRQRKIDLLRSLALHHAEHGRECAGDAAKTNDGRTIVTRRNKLVFGFKFSLIDSLAVRGKIPQMDGILSLSDRQAKLFIDTLIECDGSENKQTGVRRFYSSNPPIVAAFELAAVIAGYSVSDRKQRSSSGATKPNFYLTISHRNEIPVKKSAHQSHLKIIPKNQSGKVWCVQVPTGQIVVRRHGFSMLCHNCAEADALRSSFPTLLGGLYLREEVELMAPAITSAHEINPSRLVDVKSADSPKPEPPAQETTVVGQEPAQTQTAKPDNELLAQVVTGEGFTFDEFKRWANETGNIENADLLKGFHEVQNKVAARLLRAKTGLLKGLADIKNSQSV